MKTLDDPQIGDLVTRANSLHEMLVVEVEGSRVTCSWRILPEVQPIERPFHRAALVLLGRAGNREG